MRLYVSLLPFEAALSSAFLGAGVGAGDAALARIDDEVDATRVSLIDHPSTQLTRDWLWRAL